MRLPTVDTGLIFVVEGSHTSELQLDMTVDHWRQTLGQAPGLLAIIDGDEEAAAAVARRYPDIDVIADPDGDIAAQFGIRIWPTLIGVDGDGLITIVRHGVFEFDEAPEVRDEDVEVESGGEP